MFIPKNEQGVVHLFSKYHEQLGFDLIHKITTHFPDVTAIRNGMSVMIELEYKLRGILNHYIFRCRPDLGHIWKRNEAGRWDPYHVETKRFEHTHQYRDEDNVFTTNKHGDLMYKTLKDQVDVIVCWEIDCELPEDIEVIELNIIKHD